MATFTITNAVNGSTLTKLGSVASLAWTRTTTTATVTWNNHGMVTNDQLNVTVSSDTTAITVGVKTITLINANSFSFTCLNAGAASGTITANAVDNYLINGGYLTIDQDTRFGTNQNTSAGMGNITMSASLGGTIEFNSTLVRLIPYNTGSGNVPAYDTTISQGSASGKLIGVYSALNVAPTTPGSAVPASGYIKIRQWNSVAFTSGALTGITATATGADVAGWLEIVGVDAGTATVNRLNTFKVRGSWFKVGTTDGTRSTTYQIPSNGAIVYCPGVWVETAASSGVYEFYPCAGSQTALITTIATDAIRGKCCWISTAGLLRFGHDGTNSTGGFIPASGLNIRIPNISFNCCTVAAPTVNVLPNATLATRYDFTTTGGGVIDIDKASLNWYPSFAQPYSVTLSNVGILTQLNVSEIASPITWSNVGVGQEAANAQFGLLMATCFAGGSMTNCVWTSATLAASGRYIASLTDLNGFTFSGEKLISFAARGNATTGAATLLRVNNSTWTNEVIGCGRFLITTCTNLTFNNSAYYDAPFSTTPTANPMYAFDLASSCSNIKIDGLSFGGLALNQPYSGILNVGAAGCTGIKLRNLGTYASPLDLGGTRQDAVAWTRSTTTATATKTAHGLKVNDIIYCIVSSDVAAIVVGTKTVASVPTADTFTFTCLNAGSASGTLSYYPTMSANLFVVAASAAANDIKVQRCYTPHTRTNLYSVDNSTKNLLLESVFGDYINVPLTPGLNSYHKMVQSTPSLAAQTACYGTHWFDVFTLDTTPNTASQAWSRTTTTATVTSTGHNLRTGMLINVTVTSDASAIVKGQKTVTVLTKDTFTFTCLNAGGASGTLTFVPFSDRIGLLMNESTADTAAQYTIDAGGASFTSAGSLYMPNVNDQVTFVTPSFILGHTSFPIVAPVMAGGTIGNYDLTYAIDTGSGYSAFKNLYYPRAGGGGTSGQTNVTMTDTTGVAANDYVFGTNIAPNAKVVSITNSTTIVVDTANIGTVSGVLSFTQLPSESTIPSTGFKMKVRLKTTTANATAITSLYFYASSTETSRAYQYPLDTITLTLTGLVTGSDIVILAAGTTTERINVDANSGTTYNYVYAATENIDIGVFKAGYVPFYVRNYALSSSNSSIPIAQVADRAYA